MLPGGCTWAVFSGPSTFAPRSSLRPAWGWGTGTLEEVFEVLTWAQLGEHDKPCGLLNVAGYYDPLLTAFDRMVEASFLSESNRALLLVESEPERLLQRFDHYEPPRKVKWMDRSGT